MDTEIHHKTCMNIMKYHYGENIKKHLKIYYVFIWYISASKCLLNQV